MDAYVMMLVIAISYANASCAYNLRLSGHACKLLERTTLNKRDIDFDRNTMHQINLPDKQKPCQA